MASFLAKVYVTLKPAVNDPQGLTVKSGLKTLGFDSVLSVRIGKYMEVQLEAVGSDQAAELVRQMCQKLLANTVIEQFRFDIQEVAAVPA